MKFLYRDIRAKAAEMSFLSIASPYNSQEEKRMKEKKNFLIEFILFYEFEGVKGHFGHEFCCWN